VSVALGALAILLVALEQVRLLANVSVAPSATRIMSMNPRRRRLLASSHPQLLPLSRSLPLRFVQLSQLLVFILSYLLSLWSAPVYHPVML